MTATDTRDTAETAATVTTMSIADISVGPYYRNGLGKLRDLQKSIRENGLLHPVPVTAEGRLLVGTRRLRACRNLGWTSVPIVIADGANHIVSLIREDQQHGECAKPMTATELAALGMQIEDLLRPAIIANRGRRSPQPGWQGRQSRDYAAEAVGIPTGQYAQIRTIVLASRGLEFVPGGHMTTPIDAERQAKAQGLLDLINQVWAGEDIPCLTQAGRHWRLTISGIYATWRGPQNANWNSDNAPRNADWTPAAALGPAPRAVRTDQRKSLSAAIGTLSGLCHGLDSIQTIDPTVSADEAASWNHDLAAALRTIRTLQKKVKEHANASH